MLRLGAERAAEGAREGAERVEGVRWGAIRDVAARLGLDREELPPRVEDGRLDVALPLRVGRARVVLSVRLGVFRPVGVLRVVDAAARGKRLGSAADGRLAGPPRVVRATEAGTRPTVGVRATRSPCLALEGVALVRVPEARTPSVGRAVRAAAPPVGSTRGARRLTEAVPVGRMVASAEATAELGVTPAGRLWAVRVVPPRGFSLYSALPR